MSGAAREVLLSLRQLLTESWSAAGVGFNLYGHHGLRWSDVVAGLKEWQRFLDLELFGNGFGRGCLGESSTHVRMSYNNSEV
jgi:hypothetical protein